MKLAIIIGFIIGVLSVVASAEEAKPNGEQFREAKRKAFLEQKCKGDAACEADMKKKFEERKAKRQAMLNEKCHGDQACEAEMKKKFMEKRKERREERRENRSQSGPSNTNVK